MSKNVQHKQMTSLDEKHSELLTKFHENETKFVPKLVEEIAGLKITISSLTKKPNRVTFRYQGSNTREKNRNKTIKRRKKQISPR